jgi:outer membrane protein assembly factor BamA
VTSAFLCCVLALFAARDRGEILSAVQVHGNHVTTADEVIQLSGLAVGEAVLATTANDALARLRRSGRFRDVQVLKRYASIADPSRVVMIILVSEGPVRIDVPEDPDLPVRVVKRRGLTHLMVMPILFGEDGYGVTAGVHLSYVGLTGPRGRVSVPLTFGGERRAAIEFDRPIVQGPFSRVQAGTAIQRSRNPGFDADDARTRAWVRVERRMGPIKVGGGADWQHVSFAGQEDDVRSASLEVAFDTRRDPMLARNAVLLSATWTRRDFEIADDVSQWRLEGRGYLGLAGQSVLVVRAVREDGDGPLPAAFQSILGGSANLRGVRAGTAVGDTLAAGSLELALPLSSPLSLGRIGLSVFADAGAVHADGDRLRDQAFRSGFGGGVWLTATAFHATLSLARSRGGGGMRVHFSAGVSH